MLWGPAGRADTGTKVRAGCGVSDQAAGGEELHLQILSKGSEQRTV